MKRLFLKIKPSAILLLLKDSQQAWYPSKLARSAGMSYVHAVNLLNKLRKHGAVSSEKKGKQNIFKLTDTGSAIASVLDDFAKKCDLLAQEARQMHSKAEEKPSSSQPPEQSQENA